MADHSKPTNSSLYTNYTTELVARFADLAVGLDPAVTTATNIPTNTIRWNSANSCWEKYNGSTWAALDTGYEIDLAGARKILTNSASPALTITQTGTGNAFVVEDSASPDSTPFVIDNAGKVIAGYTSAVNNWNGAPDSIALHALSANALPSVGLYNWSTTASRNGTLNFNKSVSGIIGTNGAVANAQSLGRIVFAGDDGTAFIPAVEISASVDGTPGTNDMPGRLMFSTTADGAATPTERMRIDSAGRVGIGSVSTDTTFNNSRNITGNVTSYANFTNSEIQSDVTTTAYGYRSRLSTQAAAFTLPLIYHYSATQGTFGASSTVTSQIGFNASSTLIGATNNYGFYSDIPSGTGRWNFYAAGTADNYFAGKTLIQTPTSVGLPGFDALFEINEGSTRAITIAKSTANANGSAINIVKSRSATYGARSGVLNNDQVGAFEWWADDGTSLVRAAQIQAQVDGTPGTNNMPGRLTFATTPAGGTIPTERMRIDNAGQIKATGNIAGGYVAHAAGTTAMAFGSYNVVRVTPNATATYTTTVPAAGSIVVLSILTSGTTSYTITFGTGFKATGTLATGTVSARYFNLTFVSDGTNLIETARTVAIA